MITQLTDAGLFVYTIRKRWSPTSLGVLSLKNTSSCSVLVGVGLIPGVGHLGIGHNGRGVGVAVGVAMGVAVAVGLGPGIMMRILLFHVHIN